VGLMMIVAAVVLFIGRYRRGSPGDGGWLWVRRILEAAAGAVLFLGLLWAFRAVLNDSRFRHAPMYLETPKGTEDGKNLDAVNLAALRGLVK